MKKGVAVVAVLVACLAGLYFAWYVSLPPRPSAEPSPEPTMILHLSQMNGIDNDAAGYHQTAAQQRAQAQAQICGQTIDGVRFICVP